MRLHLRDPAAAASGPEPSLGEAKLRPWPANQPSYLRHRKRPADQESEPGSQSPAPTAPGLQEPGSSTSPSNRRSARCPPGGPGSEPAWPAPPSPPEPGRPGSGQAHRPTTRRRPSRRYPDRSLLWPRQRQGTSFPLTTSTDSPRTPLGNAGPCRAPATPRAPRCEDQSTHRHLSSASPKSSHRRTSTRYPQADCIPARPGRSKCRQVEPGPQVLGVQVTCHAVPFQCSAMVSVGLPGVRW